MTKTYDEINSVKKSGNVSKLASTSVYSSIKVFLKHFFLSTANLFDEYSCGKIIVWLLILFQRIIHAAIIFYWDDAGLRLIKWDLIVFEACTAYL